MATEIHTFEDFKLNRQLLNAIEDLQYEKPSPIQEKAIPLAMAGHDLLGIAQTGTGKTAAYLLPLLMKVKYAQDSEPRALILAPTRELVMQIDKNLRDLAKYTDLRHACLYGGTGLKKQMEPIAEGVDILVATPGRFMDAYRTGELVVKKIKTMVMDEADKMMDMGFMPQIRSILEVIPVKRQNLLFSATMPEKVIRLSEEFLEFPERVEVTPEIMAAETVSQEAYHVPNFKTKINFMAKLFEDQENFKRVIIFTKTKEAANNIYKFLTRKIEGEARVIHSNKGQNTRINAMEDFKEGNIRFLVATDVASRGMDVSMVSHVINFDVPVVYEDYVHRIGRTGRASQQGTAITFVNEPDEYHIQRIEKLIQQQIPVKPLPADVEIAKTPFEEKQELARALDKQKRKENPDFKGAFHEKKKKVAQTGRKSSDKGGRSRKSMNKNTAYKSKGRKKR
jgi:ATP-dependent RNA helicase RhlE